MAYKAIRNPDRCPSHPGAVIEDILDGFDVPKTDIANMLQISASSFTAFFLAASRCRQISLPALQS